MGAVNRALPSSKSLSEVSRGLSSRQITNVRLAPYGRFPVSCKSVQYLSRRSIQDRLQSREGSHEEDPWEEADAFESDIAPPRSWQPRESGGGRRRGHHAAGLQHQSRVHQAGFDLPLLKPCVPSS